MKEIEILVELKSDKESALKRLAKFEAHGLKKTLDIYYYDPLRTELQPGQNGRLSASFRLRQKEDKSSIAYKADHFEGDTWIYSDEHETGIMDPKVMKDILENLGYKELVRVDNQKYIFNTEDYEIVLEDVKDLGLFLEVEKVTEVADGDVENVKEEIRTFLRELGLSLGEEQNAGKPELMLRHKRAS